MPLTPAAIASINASATAEVWIPIVKLEHVDFASDVLLARNTEDVVSNGETYSAYPFDITLPDQEPEKLAVVKWVAMNASNDLVLPLRTASGPIDGTVMWVLASAPDDIQIGPMALEIRNITYNAETISGDLVIEPILDLQFGSMLMDGTNAPGLF